jgi:hypothetical protein
LKQFLVEVGAITLDFVEDVFEADHDAICNKNVIVAVSVTGQRRGACGERAFPDARALSPA